MRGIVLHILRTFLLSWIAFWSICPLIVASPVQGPQLRPLVIWHGMGDTYDAPGMLEFGESIKDIHPGIFIHSIHIHEDSQEDKKAGYYGNINEQLELVLEQLSNIDELRDGFDAIGFSQGGQFLRAYVERYNSPPVNNLITFGSQHMGVSDAFTCKPLDFFCQAARQILKSNVYSDWAQTTSIQAQYFRDPDQLETYLAVNKFLTSINNEISANLNTTYADNFASLGNLVLVLFSQDKTVLPKETSWFGSYGPSKSSSSEKTIIPMRLQTLYTEDRIGLKTLDERGAVVLATCEGEHMRLSRDCWEPLVRKFVGGTADAAHYPTTIEQALRLQG